MNSAENGILQDEFASMSSFSHFVQRKDFPADTFIVPSPGIDMETFSSETLFNFQSKLPCSKPFIKSLNKAISIHFLATLLATTFKSLETAVLHLPRLAADCGWKDLAKSIAASSGVLWPQAFLWRCPFAERILVGENKSGSTES
ncbi:hypothetical protein CDAR_487751 [Caerostris darwini]|uniref:Uncharacterized protein n=1 Tax=Caerostris darwini TaxID=1538125 RepID=A0AAV4PQH2_9ARAC|nr:hypothetical protein CDAR_487751 [Caerostris darwini]